MITNLVAIMDAILYLLMRYKYMILFPMGIVEGPIIAIIAGLLCTRGILNPLYVYMIIVSGDLVGDSIVYLLGRWSKSRLKYLKKINKLFGLNESNIESTRIFFVANPLKTISLSKIILGIGVAGIFMAGNARVSYNKFILICFITSTLQYVVYIGIGVLFGQAYLQINHYLNYFASFTILSALAIILFFLIKSQFNKLKKL